MFELPVVGPDADEAALVAHIGALETLKAQAAAAQARATAQLVQSRHAAEAARGVSATRRGRGLATEVALARRDAPARGGRHVGFATALVQEMPHTLAALESGVLTEWRATLIVRESACLSVEDRRALDAELCADQGELAGWGDGRVAAEAKSIAYRLDPHAVVDRAANAQQDRRVTIRPAPDTMTIVTALLPVDQGVSVYAALKREADTTGDGRSRGQIMADTLVERVTGGSAAAPTPIAVNLVLPEDALIGGNTPAVISDYGPVPSEIACRLIDAAAGDAESTATLRRLYASPASGALVAMESRARIFPKGLARLIRLRDQRCRTPFCDAPIRHIDHAEGASSTGATSALNGEGLCEACNYAKQADGWQVHTWLDRCGTHTAEFVTPTGARYRSTAPPVVPTPRPGRVSMVEERLRSELYPRHAA
ncbi:HNH endonuclease [Mycolicibacterium confluentis]|nr:DUF222 domain-containing protein [Mycolicibacterium confluentis]MCV7318024.1 DUF222 domain-containing protein [Mycolicibacterium confluentis]ORV32546.1 HNH endonuclease [Mycolicibacterium confluentis]